MQPTTTPGRASPAYALNVPKLDDLRFANGIATDAELARIIGVSAETLWRVRHGHTKPSNEFMARLKVAFPHSTLDSLFTLVSAA